MKEVTQTILCLLFIAIGTSIGLYHAETTAESIIIFLTAFTAGAIVLDLCHSANQNKDGK